MFPFSHLSVLGPSAAQHACAVPTRWRGGSTPRLGVGSHPPWPGGSKARPRVQVLASSSLLCDMPSCHLSQPHCPHPSRGLVVPTHGPRVAGVTSKRLGAMALGALLLLAIGTQRGLHVERAHGLFSSEAAEWANAGRGQWPGQGDGDRPQHRGWREARVLCPLRVSSGFAPHFFPGVPACPQPRQEQISFRSGWLAVPWAGGVGLL